MKIMNIAMLHFQVGELDGVSLEMDKWKAIFEVNGHKVIYIAGSLGTAKGIKIPEMNLNNKVNLKLQRNAFTAFTDFSSERAFEEAIEKLALIIKKQLATVLQEYEIDVIIPNNIFSLPLNISTSIAIYRVLKDLQIPCIAHHHDFVWERDTYTPQVPFIKEIVDNYYPPTDLLQFKHVVINSFSQKRLKQYKGVDSAIVPNVFYFQQPEWYIDDYNADLREKLSIEQNDIIFLHATRILKRKGIEIIIDLISELQKQKNLQILQKNRLYDGRSFGPENKLVLIFPNLIAEEEYKKKIERKLQQKQIDYRFCNHLFAHQRTEIPEKKYSLWDSYSHGDIVSYPSLQEGWGNQFLEAVKAKLPVIIFEYDVYLSDIGPEGFQTISLGGAIQEYDEYGFAKVSSQNIEAAAAMTIKALINNKFRTDMICKNFEIGVKHFSLKALSTYILPLLPT